MVPTFCFLSNFINICDLCSDIYVECDTFIAIILGRYSCVVKWIYCAVHDCQRIFEAGACTYVFLYYLQIFIWDFCEEQKSELRDQNDRFVDLQQLLALDN